MSTMNWVCKGGTCERGTAMPLLVLVISVILMAMGTVALKVTGNDIMASGNNKAAVEATYLAEAGIAHARASIQSLTFDSILANVDSSVTLSKRTAAKTKDTLLRVFVDTITFGGGRYKVSAYDNNDGDGVRTNDADDRIFVRATGIMERGAIRSVEVVFRRTSSVGITQRGAVVAAANVETLGNLVIDGRDHAMDGSLLGAGTLGVRTRGTLNRSGASKIGGTSAAPATSYAPTKTAADVAKVTKTGSGDPVPAGPDEAIGLSSGTLKTYAQSGVGGSQYVTDPSKLKLPVSGVTYVELACGAEWNPADFGAGAGVVVVHNSCNNATIKNLNGGSLKGILIADDIVHVHNDIIGMIVQTSPAPSSGNCIGNGGGNILYSSIAISSALSSITNQTLLVAWRDM